MDAGIPSGGARRGETVRIEPAAHGGQCVRAARAFTDGAFIGRFEGTPVAAPTRLSLQTGADTHIEPAADCPLAFLNHACSPNAAFRGRDLHALRPLTAGDEITIDYNCHEADMSAPFDCRCGAQGCLGRIAGWDHLTPAQRAARRDQAAVWLSASGSGS